MGGDNKKEQKTVFLTESENNKHTIVLAPPMGAKTTSGNRLSPTGWLQVAAPSCVTWPSTQEIRVLLGCLRVRQVTEIVLLVQ